jgi:hypothetical protein
MLALAIASRDLPSAGGNTPNAIDTCPSSRSFITAAEKILIIDALQPASRCDQGRRTNAGKHAVV